MHEAVKKVQYDMDLQLCFIDIRFGHLKKWITFGHVKIQTFFLCLAQNLKRKKTLVKEKYIIVKNKRNIQSFMFRQSHTS